jgi:N-acetylglutamate synthase-like GNAT family acetyltransferase
MSRPKTETRRVWRLRRARKGDWSAILSLQSVENRPSRQDSTVSEYFVALVDRELVGCVAGRCEGGAGYLYGLVVAKKWRKKGIGHALTDICLAHLRRAKARAVFALSMFWNVRFFKNHGFVIVKRGLFPELVAVHADFAANWSRHSTLLSVKFGT